MTKAVITALICLNAFSVLSQSRGNKGYIGSPNLYYGVAYYPEAWNLEGVDEDIRQMKTFHINVVRMAEFSWALMEPEEGRFEFEWLHQIVDKLVANGIEVVLGTPTATPPIWAAEKYPEIFVTDESGVRREHGGRRNCSYTSQKYRELSEKICQAMAREFGQKPGVIGWQTDNEFNIIFDYSEQTRRLWHQWLEEKYQTIDNLNQVWHTNLWSQRYQRFDQIPMPKPSVWHHSSLRFDWGLFSNQQIVDYQNIHIQAIRKYSNLPITHDGMPGQEKDYPKLFENLDFMAVNCYHGFQAYPRWQTNYDRMRGYGKGMHWLFETAPNNSGGGPSGQTWFIHQPDGAFRAVTWMNYAMGGQGAMFWLWRQQPAGQEMPHGAFLSAWGEPAANADDLRQMGRELKTHSDLLMNAPVDQARIALFYSHQNDLGLRIEESSNGIDYYANWTDLFYSPISNAFLHRDVIHEQSNLEPYEVLILPLMPYLSKELSGKLEQWVRKGGILIAGPMTAYRDGSWTAHTDRALGWFEAWTGIEVVSRIPADDYSREGEPYAKIRFDDKLKTLPVDACKLWSEALNSSKGTVLGVYQNGMHHQKPAIIENRVGKGKVIFLGTYPGEKAYQKLVLDGAREKNIQPLATGDPYILVVPRTQPDGTRLLFAINLGDTTKNLQLGGAIYTDLLSGNQINGASISLKPFEVLMLQPKK